METTICLGTTKGAFLITSSGERSDWRVSGPHCDGWPINHVLGDPVSGSIWAAGGGEWLGAGVWHSDDGGQNWTLSHLAGGLVDEWAASDSDLAAMIGWEPKDFPFPGEIDAIWSLHHARGAIYAGAKPANLYVSRDNCRTWERNAALAEFPGRDDWNPGAAGLTLHTILTAPDDPARMWLGISAAGVFATEDGGASWDRRNRLSNAAAQATHDHPAAPSGGEIGHCVHNMARAADGTIYQQNHHGTWRSRDDGRHWDDIGTGLPSTFGFPIAVHPSDPHSLWVIPLNGDMAGRFPPDARAAVWKSTDGGETWSDKRAGLPGESCFFTVLRQAMATDRADPAGVYFGTNTGSLFASFDAGETWSEIARHLPTILSVEVTTR